jgi:membrane protein required for colicin V production
LTLFDLIALAILAVSALIGLARGALREVTTIIALIVAAFVAVFGLRFVGPIARAAIHPGWLGNVTALLVVFLTVYVALRVISAGMIRSLHSTRTLGLLDRLVGAGFGVVRWLIVLGVLNIGVHLAPSAAGLPGWIANAKLYPLSERCADVIRAVAPKGSQLAHRLTPEIEKAVKTGGDDQAGRSDSGQSDESGYDHAARKGLDDVAERLR